MKLIWLASFPKSGNTWFRLLLANLQAGQTGPVHINDPPSDQFDVASSRPLFEMATMLDSSLLSHDEIDVLRPRVYETMFEEKGALRWFKVHDAYSTTPNGVPLLGRRPDTAAVYLVRDPRDVAVSLASHLGVPVDKAIVRLNSPKGALGDGLNGIVSQLRQKLTDWSGHVRSWLDQTDMPVRLLRYEDMVDDTRKHFAGVLEFAGVPASEEAIARAVSNCEFRRLQREEIECGFVERWSHSAPFFRSGQVGRWRAILTDKQEHAITDCHAEVMERMGYS